MSLTNKESIQNEEQAVAHNYSPLPVSLERGEGVYVWDVEGKRYIDCIAGISTASLGHCHPRLVQALTKQASTLDICSRSVCSYELGSWGEYITKMFGYDRVLPSSGGVEAVETAIKTARSWGYKRKGIPTGKAIVICCQRNFHGRSMLAVSLSDEESSKKDFDPYLPGIIHVPFGCSKSLENVLEKYGNECCCFIVEPVQGEGGINVPPVGYLSECLGLCKKHNVLFIADEVQTGLGRTGKMLACEWDNVRPDLLCLGKALGGGVFPISAVLGPAEIMDCIEPGTHGSTWGGNPIACAVSKVALKLIQEETLVSDVAKLGEMLLSNLKQISERHANSIADVRGRGLFCCIELRDDIRFSANDLSERCLKHGVLMKVSRGTVLRIHPPLIITEDELNLVCQAIDNSLVELESCKENSHQKVDNSVSECASSKETQNQDRNEESDVQRQKDDSEGNMNNKNTQIHKGEFDEQEQQKDEQEDQKHSKEKREEQKQTIEPPVQVAPANFRESLAAGIDNSFKL
ncbi:Lysine/ornithine aminotransferase [Monocercomonoides exilis]|uniref:Lysine/ornithine aminotransferase n=1 Tax=Monocercomonoides exilis TaxID=2049356 RepID=UPI00355AC7ED|nr:Lysine/ornithine aminotransferase [Monocercomonoides exilis]|eukprot:MONOS_1383.1-p1 / transcript=MONOS_1383.1 / gene=MONOS_1383 / organism=Monocercomonoides_exilis_PA203 / gene_product=Lysine/ornithine aminotransferase / transcript_product=Lysine/ornithine aminotransferase / location=Mono_scaffold00024:44134-45987(-) / protein_length=520 / sequence_SO=supercontig / SO=protein_coding / is_pseudo=false